MQSIQLAFATSSQALLRLLQHDLGLNHTLAALKHYFLLDKGDLLVSFLDTAEEELAKPASEVSVIRLQSLLDLGQPLCFFALLAVKSVSFGIECSQLSFGLLLHALSAVNGPPNGPLMCGSHVLFGQLIR